MGVSMFYQVIHRRNKETLYFANPDLFDFSTRDDWDVVVDDARGPEFRHNSYLYAAVGNVRNWLADDERPYITPIGMPRGTPGVFQDQYAGGEVEQYGPYLGEAHLGWFTVDELLTSFDRNLIHFRGETPATPVTYAELLPDFYAFLKRMRQAHPHGDLVFLFGFDQG